MGMDFAANRLQIQQKSAGKPKGLPRGRSFLKGQSGNPAGKRPGTRNRATIIAEEMLDCETRPLLRGAIDDAKGGDGVMARFCLSRIIGPRRDRPVRFELPPLQSAADLKAAMEAVTSAVAQGELTIREAWEFSQTLDTFIHAIDATEFAERLGRLEAAQARHEKEAAEDRRWELRVLDCICKDIRAALEWRGIDPASSRVLLDEEAKLVGFVDTLELLAADLDFEDDADEEDPAGGEDSPDDDDAWPLLDREADRLGKPFLDGSRPDFKRGSLDELWGWAVTQYLLVPAIPYHFAAG